MKNEMDSFIEEELEALLKLKKGDPVRLNHIKELCEGHKLIPISDRKYVERLASQYLHKDEKKKLETPKSEPKLLTEKIPKPEITQQLDFGKRSEQKFEEEVGDEKPSLKPPQNNETKFELKSKNKLFIGTAAIVLAIIVIVTVLFNGIDIPTNPSPQQETPTLTPPYITLETDQKEYVKADIISISGETNPIITGEIEVILKNSAGQVIWNESIKVKDEGEFSTLLIAGGIGWEQSGEYTIFGKHDSLETETTFEFES